MPGHGSKRESAFATDIMFRFQRGSSILRCANFGHSAPIFSRSGEVPLEAGIALQAESHPNEFKSIEVRVRQQLSRGVA